MRILGVNWLKIPAEEMEEFPLNLVSGIENRDFGQMLVVLWNLWLGGSAFASE